MPPLRAHLARATPFDENRRRDVGPSPYTGVQELHLTPSPNTFREFEEFVTSLNGHPAGMVLSIEVHGSKIEVRVVLKGFNGYYGPWGVVHSEIRLA